MMKVVFGDWMTRIFACITFFFFFFFFFFFAVRYTRVVNFFFMFRRKITFVCFLLKFCFSRIFISNLEYSMKMSKNGYFEE